MKKKLLLTIPILSVLSAGTLSLCYVEMHKKNSPLKESDIVGPSSKDSKTIPFSDYMKSTLQSTEITEHSDSPINPLYQFKLGDGYRRETGTSTKTSIFSKKANDNQVSLTSPSFKSNYFNNKNWSNIYSALGVNDNLKFNVQSSLAPRQLAFYNSLKSQDNSFNAAFSMANSIDEKLQNTPSIGGSAQADIARSQLSKDWSSFENKYSDSYIGHLTASRKVLFNINFKSVDENMIDKLKDNFNLSNDLSGIETLISHLPNKEKNKLHLKINYLTLPLTQNETILPSLDFTANNFSQFIFEAKANATTFANDYQAQNGIPSNLGQWFNEGINNDRDLWTYKTIPVLKNADIINKYEKLIAEFPQINKYFDEAITLREDYNAVYAERTVIDTFNQNPGIYNQEVNNLQRYLADFESLFNPASSSLIKLLKDHDATQLIAHAKNFETNLNNDDGIKIIDYIEHTKFSFDSNDNDKKEFKLSNTKIHIYSMAKIDNGITINFFYHTSGELANVESIFNIATFKNTSHQFYNKKINLMSLTDIVFHSYNQYSDGNYEVKISYSENDPTNINDVGYILQTKKLFINTNLESTYNTYDYIYEGNQIHPE